MCADAVRSYAASPAGFFRDAFLPLADYIAIWWNMPSCVLDILDAIQATIAGHGANMKPTEKIHIAGHHRASTDGA